MIENKFELSDISNHYSDVHSQLPDTDLKTAIRMVETLRENGYIMNKGMLVTDEELTVSAIIGNIDYHTIGGAQSAEVETIVGPYAFETIVCVAGLGIWTRHK